MSSGGEKTASAAVLRDASRGAAGADSTDPEGGAAALPPEERTDPNAAVPERVSWKLLVLRGPRAGAELPLNGDIVTVGRGTDNGLTIPDVSVSRHHVRFSRDAEGFSVTDLDSGNGTRVNGAKVQTARLHHGDEILLGDTALQLVKAGTPAAAPPPAAPTGQVADSGARTQNLAVRVQPTQAMKALPPLPKQGKQQISNGRLVFYAVTFFVMVAGFAGMYVWKNRPDLVSRMVAPDEAAADPATNALKKAKESISRRRWDEAYQLLSAAAVANPGNEKLQHWAESAHFDAQAKKLFDDAQAALTRGDYAQAVALASQVPPDADFGADAAKLVQSMPEVCANALNDARAALREGDRDRARGIVERVLAVDPANADGQSLRDFILHPPAQKRAEPPPAPRVKQVAAPRGPNFRCYGPAITAYLTNDISSAIRYADSESNAACQDLPQLLSDFRLHYSKAVELAEGEHVPEASLEFSRAAKIDQQIAEGRSSAPGRSARQELSKMEYLLALDCKGDDQLGRRAQHLRTAVAANPNDDLAKKELDKAVAHARELFQDAYINKDGDPDTARREFRVVVQALPPGDETAAKSQHWLQVMSGTAPSP